MDIQPSCTDKSQCCAQRWSCSRGRRRQFPVPSGRPGPDLLWHRPHQAAAERPWRVGWGNAPCKSLKYVHTGWWKCNHIETYVFKVWVKQKWICFLRLLLTWKWAIQIWKIKSVCTNVWIMFHHHEKTSSILCYEAAVSSRAGTYVHIHKNH